MSSTYRVLCVSHDPSIRTEIEWSTGTNNVEAAQRVRDQGVPGHENCELVVGQYSYPLIEVGCLRKHHHGDGGNGWVAADWLRLLALAQSEPLGTAAREVANSSPYCLCWSPALLKRLRNELFPDREST